MSNAFYPNDLDIFGFSPCESVYQVGDWITDARTGTLGKIVRDGRRIVVSVKGIHYELKEN